MPSSQVGLSWHQSLRQSPSYKWLVAGTVGLGVLTSTMDGSITNVALPTLAQVFKVDAGTIIWIPVAYLLASLGLMLTLGRLGDAIGRKRVFITGFFVFTVGLVVATISQTFTQLLFARVIQGIGQAMIISNGNALVVGAFPAKERGRALGIEGAIVGLGLTGGAPLGGFLLDALGWRSLFFTRIPFALLAPLLVAIILRPDSKSMGRVRFDFIGAITLFLGLASFLLTVNRGPRIGWTEPLILSLAILAAVSLTIFVLVQKRVAMPVLDLSLFRNRLFSMANSANLLQFLSQGAIVILMPFMLIRALDLTPSQAGLVLITLPAVRLVIAPFAGWVADKVPSRVICTTGLAVMVVGYLGLRTVGLETPLALLVVFLLVEGFGTAIFQPGNNSSIMGSVPPSHLGTASGMIATVRETSQAIGIALAGTLYAVFQASHQAKLIADGTAAELASRQAVAFAFQDVLTIWIFFVVAATIVSALRGPDGSRGGPHATAGPHNATAENTVQRAH